MAVTVADAWTTATYGSDPNGAQTISSTTQGLVLICRTYEFTSQVTISQMEIGGQSFDGEYEEFWENGSADQCVHYWWWTQATKDNFIDNDIDFTDSGTITKQVWSIVQYDGVDQSSPVRQENNGNNTSTDQLSLTTTSTSDDYDVVALSRQSVNRNITSWGTLTEQWKSEVATTYWTGCAHDVGGVSPIVIDGDGIADDITYNHIVIQAISGNTDLSVRGTGRGIMRGVARGVG